ncbi:hypothetical protein STSP2_00999 [Anaerohalosphaera lusitana]|uniref:Lipoprotein n=1 Tax=Anaerohalosphaera lusitana TaxID=1936003 RepID=A0A1U9NJ80_9BACT|nr:hypothetical protein [Anaerohalosphaera lusitana]AQT67847.1 hypothetical protein STSP2_00999 [Anaerohalosphaera lusitana]
MGTLRTIVICGCVCVLMVSAGCLPEFENPLPESRAEEVSGELLGCWWRTLEDGTVQQVSFLPRAESKKFDAVFAFGIKSKDGAAVDMFEVYSVDLGESFLCAQKQVMGERRMEEEQPYFIMNYEVREDGRLEIRMLSLEKFKAAVEGGELAGTVKEKDESSRRPWDVVEVSASGEEVAEYIEKTPVSELVTDDEDLLLVFERTPGF